MATYDDFTKLDTRVGKIIKVEDFPEAKKPALEPISTIAPTRVARDFPQSARRVEEISALGTAPQTQRRDMGKSPQPFGIRPISAIPASAPLRSTDVHLHRRSLFLQKLASVAGRDIVEMGSELTIDFGPEIGVKASSAQLVTHYTKEQLQGKQVLGVVNFPPRKIGPFLSEVLTLGVPDKNGSCVLLVPDKTDAVIGGRLY